MSRPHRDFKGRAKVYTLSDENGNVFYVGCTILNIEKRLACHLTEAKMLTVGNPKKNDLIRSLNYKVVVNVVEEIRVTGYKAYHASHSARHLEYKWILEFINQGYSLCNTSKEISYAKKYLSEYSEI